MAIDKSRTSPAMKAMIVFLALTFVLGIGFAGVAGLSSCSPNAPLLPGSGTGSTGNTADTSATIAAINARFTPTVSAREASITADPKNYDLLVAQANDYYDWAAQISQTLNTNTDETVQLFAGAATYYQRALAAKPGDPNVGTDYAISLFYSNETTQAIAVGEQVRKDNPTFSPVLFNLGIFYANSGTADAKVKATAAFQAYLKLDPNGPYADNAKQFITDLGSTVTTGTGQ